MMYFFLEAFDGGRETIKDMQSEPWRWGSLYNFTLLLSDASAMRFSGNALLLSRNGMIKYIRTSVDTVNLWLNGTSTCQEKYSVKAHNSLFVNEEQKDAL